MSATYLQVRLIYECGLYTSVYGTFPHEVITIIYCDQVKNGCKKALLL